jgi:hypothetical protein
MKSTDRALLYNVSTRLYMINIWNVNTYIYTDKLQTLTGKRQTWPLVREGAPRRHDSNRQTVTNIWSWWSCEPEGARYQNILTDWLTDRPTVSRNVTLLWLLVLLRSSLFLPHSALSNFRFPCCGHESQSGRWTFALLMTCSMSWQLPFQPRHTNNSVSIPQSPVYTTRTT